ncbi:hypothetical protein MTO96_013066 [Rhipicephalus appendiculatus]
MTSVTVFRADVNEQLERPPHSVVCYVRPDQELDNVPSGCTHVVYQSLFIDVYTLRLVDAGLPRKYERTIQSLARLNAPNVRPMVMVTMEPGFLASLCHRAVVSGHAGRLARNVGRWLLQRGYIGVDLDLWTPSNKDEANASFYSAIVAAMKRTLDTGRLLLSANVYPMPGLMEDMQLAKLRGDVHLMVLNPCADTSEPCPPDGDPELALAAFYSATGNLAHIVMAVQFPGSANWTDAHMNDLAEKARFVRWAKLRGVAIKGDWTANTSAPLFRALADYEAPRNDFLDWPAKSTP